MILFQIIAVPASVIISVVILLRTRRGQISKRQGLVWSLIWLLGSAVIARPSLSNVLARWLGVGRGSDLIFYSAILVGLWIALQLFNNQQRLRNDLTVLARQSAMREAVRGGELDSPEHMTGASK